jgi:hypothetical protein
MDPDCKNDVTPNLKADLNANEDQKLSLSDPQAATFLYQGRRFTLYWCFLAKLTTVLRSPSALCEDMLSVSDLMTSSLLSTLLQLEVDLGNTTSQSINHNYKIKAIIPHRHYHITASTTRNRSRQYHILKHQLQEIGLGNNT